MPPNSFRGRPGGMTGDPRIDRRGYGQGRGRGQGQGQQGGDVPSVMDEELIMGRRIARLPHSGMAAFLPHEPQRYEGPGVIQAPAISGRRMTDRGAFDPGIRQADVWQDLRMQAQRASVVPDQEIYRARLRVAGRITGTEIFNSAPTPERPWLTLRASTSANAGSSNDCSVKVTAGMSEGMEANREFFLGGGMTAAFLLNGWDNVRVAITSNSADQVIQYAWVADGLQSSNMDLYFPDAYRSNAGVAPAGVVTAVPEGAYELVVGFPDDAAGFGTVVQISFVNPASIITNVFVGHDSVTGESFYRWGEPIPVVGTGFLIAGLLPAPDTTLYSLVWKLRPL